ncbi:transcription factor TFIIIB subunit brf1 [Coemansia aciculifera]|uniref:B-related factor 1 n=1 Tax=Coemansia aciculifera TaxID=417176 RepID=A0A9W8M5N0_9FUNG|nr:transcription factor TFIIIB subunit brf1 [Coemansia aciculifera]
MGCKACGGTEIEHDSAKGMSYCAGCGEVCEENAIIAEVTFGESSSGAAVVTGSFVRAGQTRANMGGPGRYGSGQESREITMQNARRRIQSLATPLGLSEHYVEVALRTYNLLLAQNFTKGRRSVHVAAACLYAKCRLERNSLMLIDFSDVLKISVFKLGSTFARLVNVLGLKIPIVDPSIYILRFASLLEFGDKTQQVCLDATRLVQRMDRDWIRTGRRPSGICGACLLIAARMHNFRRTQKEIIRVVKIADTTLRRRLDEFRKTQSSDLTVADFRSVWLEQQSDPPAFTNNRQKARAATKAQHLQNPGSLEAIRKRIADDADSDDGEAEAEDDESIEDTLDQIIREEVGIYLQQDELKLISSSMVSDNFGPDVSTWSDLDDDEVKNIMLTEEEVATKTEIWDRENKEFMEEKERKRLARGLDTSARKRRRSTKKKVVVPGATPFESAQNMLASRRMSKKINYPALQKLLGPEVIKPKIDIGHPNMIPSAAPSRMYSMAGTPAAGSGYASPSQENAFGGATQVNSLDRLPAALANIALAPDAVTETIVYEEGDHDLQSTAVDPAVVAAAADDDDDEEEEEEEYHDQGGFNEEEDVVDDDDDY